MGGHWISPRFRPERPVARRALSTRPVEEARLKKLLEILEACDLTGSLRAAAELVGCDHRRVAQLGAWSGGGRWWPAGGGSGRGRWSVRSRRSSRSWSSARAARSVPTRRRRNSSRWAIWAPTARRAGRSRTRSVAGARRAAARRDPGFRSPGLWMQWDYGNGPEVAGRQTLLFCTWLAWSRFRVVLPLWDQTLPSVVMALDRTLQRFGGAPTYALTDNDPTVSVDEACGIAVRNPKIVSASRDYWLTIAGCVPADPESKGGSEATVSIAKATVRIAKGSLVPTDHDLRSDYEHFAELELAREASCERVAAREHRVKRRPAALALHEERERLQLAVDAAAHGLLRPDAQVSWQSTISVRGATYSVPAALTDERVWVRVHGSDLIIGYADAPQGPRRGRTPRPHDAGAPVDPRRALPLRPTGALERRPRVRSAEEHAFLQLWPGAEAWLGARRRGGGPPGCGASWPRPSTWPSCTGRRRSSRRWRPAPRQDASQTATWPRCSPTGRPAPYPVPGQGLGRAVPAPLDLGLRGDRDGGLPALGARRGAARAALGGGRRSRPGDDPDAPARLRAAGRQDVRCLGGEGQRDPDPDRAGAQGAGVDRPENLCLAGPSGTARATSSKR
jgi:hypothetical protein